MTDPQISGADKNTMILRYYTLISGDGIGLSIAQGVNWYREGTNENFHQNAMREILLTGRPWGRRGKERKRY